MAHLGDLDADFVAKAASKWFGSIREEGPDRCNHAPLKCGISGVHKRLIVLKFGGSVLSDEDSLSLVVHEVYRWRRDGWRVVVVVSALAGATDRLLRQSQRDYSDPDPAMVAALVSTGEHQCAALLGLQFDRAGVPATVLTPAAIGLVATGHPLDANPAAVQLEPIERALARDGVAIVPGYVAVDPAGRTVVLGRGGSDLTALFLAGALRAPRCRLIKDVDALYERDPQSRWQNAPRCYSRASWEDALATDGSIIQYKAVLFARAENIEFELTCFNATEYSIIGRGPSVLRAAHPRVTPLSVSVLGLGTVGGGTVQALQKLDWLFELRATADRNPDRHRAWSMGQVPVLEEPVLAAEQSELVIEAMGGTCVAADSCRAAIESGAHLITSNKAVVAHLGPGFIAAAEIHGCAFRASASVGGSTPILERLCALGSEVRAIRGVLNGTTNFVVEGAFGAEGLEARLEKARQRGYAEPHPEEDLAGVDAAGTLVGIASVLGQRLALGAVQLAPGGLDAIRMASWGACGRAIRQVATLRRQKDGTFAGSVGLEVVEADDPLSRVPAESNAVVIETTDGRIETLRGRGAGRWPATESVIGDALELQRNIQRSRMVSEQDQQRRSGNGERRKRPCRTASVRVPRLRPTSPSA